MNNKDYIRLSLELHLFFDRIMKEHSLFLEASFMEKDSEFRKVANNFQKAFGNILGKAIDMASGNINERLLTSGEIVTKDTLNAEYQTNYLTGSAIDVNLTMKEKNLKSGDTYVTNELLKGIGDLNKEALPLIQDLIHFKNDVLNQVLRCKMYTTNYPLLITHIMQEAKMYYALLSKIEKREMFTANYIYEQELFWDNIMMEHAEFIRGLLDPSEKDLILTADKFANEYEAIIKKYSGVPNFLTSASLKETIHFKDFKVTGEEGILNCKIKSIIIPLLADHVVREANHFIRILTSIPRVN